MVFFVKYIAKTAFLCKKLNFLKVLLKPLGANYYL